MKEKITTPYSKITEMSKFFYGYVFDQIKISGGEPTLHKEFSEISKNIRKLFLANAYILATNGAMLSKYLNEIKNYDRVDFSRYAGFNDDIFYNIKKLGIPNVVHIDRFDKENTFDNINDNYPEEFNKAYYCQYSKVIKICHNRLAPCCLAFANCQRRKEFKYEDFSVLIDDHWAENIKSKKEKMRDFCNKCYIKISNKDNSLLDPIIFSPIIMDDDQLCKSVITDRHFGKNRFYTPANKIMAGILEQLYKASTEFHVLQDISGTTLSTLWQGVLFSKVVTSEKDKDTSFAVVPIMSINDLKQEPEAVNVRMSHITTNFFDIPYGNQTFRLTFKFDGDIKNAPSFLCQIQDESFNFVAQNTCTPTDMPWEWEFTQIRACDKIRILISSDRIYEICLPSALTLASDFFSLDYIKYQQLSLKYQQLSLEYQQLSLESKNEIEQLQEQRDVLLASRWRKLGRKLGIVKAIKGLREQ
jgi:organic radical activating enzyme